MPAYLKFFELENSPFEAKEQSNLVLGTKALRAAFAEIEAGLADDAPRICVSGRTGMGKTSLARALPKLLRESARVVLLLNPSLSWRTLRSAIIKQLDLEGGILSRKALLAARSGTRRLLVVIDQAERISQESLEHLDILLNYRTDDDRQLIHCILLSNLQHAGQDADCPLLWWLDSLNTLQLEFAPIPASGVASYIAKHLKRAGWKGGDLFTSEAIVAIHRLSGGVPGAVGALCERLLTEAATRGLRQIDGADVHQICGGNLTPEGAEARQTRGSGEAYAAAPARSQHAPAKHDAGRGATAAPTRSSLPLFSRVEAPIDLDSYFTDAPGQPTAAEPGSRGSRLRRGRLIATAIATALLAAVAAWLLAPGLLGGNAHPVDDSAPAAALASSRATTAAPAARISKQRGLRGPLARAKGPLVLEATSPTPDRVAAASVPSSANVAESAPAPPAAPAPALASPAPGSSAAPRPGPAEPPSAPAAIPQTAPAAVPQMAPAAVPQMAPAAVPQK